VDPGTHIGLAYAVAGTFARWGAAQGHDFEDLRNEATAALTVAARTFQPSRGIAFSTYAGACMKNALVGLLSRPRPRHLPLLGKDGLVIDPSARPEPDRLEAKEAAQEIERLLELLAPESRALVRAHFGIGEESRSLAQIAAERSVSRQGLHEKLTRALEKMRAAGGTPPGQAALMLSRGHAHQLAVGAGPLKGA
jgi:RNA polymerase sigma factor (sigma-70 family)